MDPRTAKLRGLILVGVLSLLAARPAAQDPAAPLWSLSVRDGPAALGGLAKALGPVPDAVPAEVRMTLGVAYLGLRAKAGRSPRELVELLSPGPATLAIVAPEDRPAPVFLTRVRDRPAVDALLDGLTSLPRLWRGDVLALAEDRRVLAVLPALPEIPAESAAGFAVRADLGRLRASRGGGDRSATDGWNATSRFLFGPLVRVWERSGSLSGELVGADRTMRLAVRLDATLEGDVFQMLTGLGGTPRRAPAPPADTIAFVSLDRHLEKLFRGLDRLLSEEDVASARTFLSTADRLLSGASFVDDLLGALVEPIHLYVLDAQPPALPAESPRIQLPAFTLVASVPDDRVEPVRAMLERAARTLVLLINAQRHGNGQAPFRLRPERAGELEGLVAEPPEWLGSGRPPIEHGISPALLFGHRHVILSTTRQGAAAIGESLRSGRKVELVGDHLELRGPSLARILRRNLSLLELTRVLDEGETRAQARRFWATLLAVIDAVEVLRAQARTEGDATTVELLVRRR